MRSLCLCAMAASKQSWAGWLFTHRTKAVVKSFAREHLCFHKSSPELLFTSELHCSWVCALKIEVNETQHFLTFWTENTKSALHFLFLIMLIMLFIYCWQKIEARHFNTAQESSAMTFTLTVTAKIQQHFTLIEMWSPTRSGEKEKISASLELYTSTDPIPFADVITFADHAVQIQQPQSLFRQEWF